MKIKKIHPLQWIFEPFENEPDFRQKKMFGCESAYFGDRLILVLAAGEEPWNGVLLPTDREHHEKLIEMLPNLHSHQVLGKWLYVSQTDPDFESTVAEIQKKILRRDPKFGTIPTKSRKLKRKRA